MKNRLACLALITTLLFVLPASGEDWKPGDATHDRTGQWRCTPTISSTLAVDAANRFSMVTNTPGSPFTLTIAADGMYVEELSNHRYPKYQFLISDRRYGKSRTEDCEALNSNHLVLGFMKDNRRLICSMSLGPTFHFDFDRSIYQATGGFLPDPDQNGEYSGPTVVAGTCSEM